MLPDLDRAERIGEFWSYPQSRAIAELLIDAEEDRVVRAVLVGMLWEADPGNLRTTSQRYTASRRSAAELELAGSFVSGRSAPARQGMCALAQTTDGSRWVSIGYLTT